MSATPIPLEKLAPFNDNVRKGDASGADGHIVALAADIAEHGLLHPITVVKTDDDRYEVVAGWRRVLAHRMLKAKTILAVVIQGDSDSLFRLSLSENMHRHRLSIKDTCVAIRRCYDECQGNVKQVCELTHLAPTTVRRYVDVSQLGDEFIARLDAQGDDRLTLAEAHALAVQPAGPQDEAPDGSQAAEAPASKKEKKKPVKNSPWIYDPDGNPTPIPEDLYPSVFQMVSRHAKRS